MRGRLALLLAASSACLFPSVGDLAGADASTKDVADEEQSVDAQTADASLDADAPPDVKDSGGPTPSPIAFVQLNAQEFNAQGTALISLANVAAHDSLIVCAGLDAVGTIAVTDDHADTFTEYVSFDSTDDGAGSNFVWAAFDVAGGNTTVTVTTQVTHDDFEVYLLEYGGLTAFDVQSSAQGTATGTDQMASGFATTTFGNELIFGYGTEGVGVQGTNFTLRSGFEADVVEDRIVKTAGAYQATATMQSGAGWEISMVAFKGF